MYEMENIGNITSYLSVAMILIMACAFLYYKTGSHKLPPGPMPLPLLGNILQLAGKDEMVLFTEFRKKYGDIFCVRFFNRPLIVFSGYDVLKEAFVKNGDIFSDRPETSIFRETFKNDAIVMASGESWKRNRKFALQTLRNFGMGKNILQTKIHEEIRCLLKTIESYNGESFDICALLNIAVSNIMCCFLFGKRFSYADEDLQEHIKRLENIGKMKHMFFVSPLAKYLPGDPLSAKKFLKNVEETAKFYSDPIKEHLRDYDRNDVKDVIDAYLKETNFGAENEGESTFSMDQILAICNDLHVTGSDTVGTSISWGLVHLLREPDIQRKMHEELRDNVPHNKLPGIDDKPALPYLEAMILETLRHGAIVPFVSHGTSVETTFKGYTIPKDAALVINLQSVLFDEEIWGDPSVFRPSRFLEKEGDPRLQDYFLPFSIGRRVCLGESLAKTELFLFLSALVQRFEFLPEDSQDPPTLDYTLGTIRAPKPFKIRAINRRS